MDTAEIKLESDGVLQVSGRLNFETVPWLFGQARELLNGQSDFILNLGRVERANSAGLVLLLECLEESRRHGSTLYFAEIPESLRHLAKASNVLELLTPSPAKPSPSLPKQPHAAPKRRKKKTRRR